jgi:uncharacterized protein DUF222
MFERLADIDTDADEATLIERIAELEHLKCVAAAGQVRLTAALDQKRRAREAAQGVPAAKRGRGLASEIALARHDSPNCGGRHLGFARALSYEMPHTLAALEAGVLSEWRATLIVRESACLSVQDRGTLDERMCADQSELEGNGDTRITAKAKAIAYELDPHAVVDRAVRAERERTVTIRPAPDNMTIVSILLPMARGVSVYASLKRAADTCGDGRGRAQVMADTAYERITGQPADVPTPIAVNLVLTDETLLGGASTPAHVPGYGPVPAAVACRLAGDAIADERSKATLRRLYRHPASGALVAMESRSRLFPASLARFIAFRDDTCRTPYCNAPIRHTDHATPAARGGATTAVNGLGTCEACNYAKEAPGWRVHTIEADGQRHTAEYVTPTGAHHESHAPPLLNDVVVFKPSAVEARLAQHLAGLAAA